MKGLKALLLLIAMISSGSQTQAAEGKIKIDLMFSLSGPTAVLSQQARDGFLLAAEKLDSRFGSTETEIIVVDDEQKPDVAVNKAKELIERHKVDFVVDRFTRASSWPSSNR